MKKLLFLAAAVLITGVATAQSRVQLGVRAGLFSQDLQLQQADFGDDSYTTEANMGFHAAVVSRIRLTAIGSGAIGFGLFLQPEVVYSQNRYKIMPEGGSATRIRMQSVDIPVLLSAKVSIVRVQAGPVFNAMNRLTPIKGDIEITPLKPSVGYAVGASVDIIGGLVIDGRYNGQFKQLKNHIMAGETVYDGVRGSLSSWTLGVSWLF